MIPSTDGAASPYRSARVVIRPGPATIVLGLGTLVSHGFGLSLVPAMLPRISDEFLVGYGTLGVVVATGLIAYSTSAVVAGWIADRVPARGLLIGTYLLTGSGLATAGLASSPATLGIAVVILGFSAPVSWSVTLHVAGETIAPRARARVMAGAASGAAVGVLINGVLVQTSAGLHTWRVSFAIALALVLVPIIGSLLVFRHPVASPTRPVGWSPRAAFKRVARSRAGRVAAGAGMAAGLAGFPFSVFLTATALDEMGVSDLGAAALWFLIGGLGTVAGPILGRVADRFSPLSALAVGTISYAAGLVVLITAWSYAGLAFAAIGFALMNYPVWGLIGAIANHHFDTGTAVRVVTLGLIGAAAGGALSNAATGAWIGSRGSFRAPAVVLAAIMLSMSVWQMSIVRRGGLASVQAGSGRTPI